ncbi:hypothetical protein G7Z17_g11968 [Cylindrodendrum hubeiense]|uniref:Uncharacterized protein n=1 Tax=Cylindrodendrum hubeiense TaxID=595255 RepID=A0A9P5H2X5_9HYPO|nr:hypothetical protein G7Z17_g11968 [Cylindrodendrum hubeiense]
MRLSLGCEGCAGCECLLMRHVALELGRFVSPHHKLGSPHSASIIGGSCSSLGSCPGGQMKIILHLHLSKPSALGITFLAFTTNDPLRPIEAASIAR